MSDESRAPVEVDQIECAPLGRAKIAVRVTGRWRGRRRLPDARAFLVIEADGRRHRFPAMPEPRRPRLGRPGPWEATFALPSWLEPHLGQAMTLWLGSAEIPLPGPLHVSQLPDVPADALAAEVDEGSESAGDGPAAMPAPQPDPAPEPEPIRSGQGPEELQATLAALRAELQQRASSEAQLRGALAGAEAELKGRSAHQAALEETQTKLREQLGELLALVERESSTRSEVESRAMVLAGEVAELQDRLAGLTAARDQVAEETGSLRGELERAAREALHLRDELVQLRSVAEQEGAERVRLEARAAELAQQLAGLRAELAQSEVAREAALGEAAGLREELERLGAELALAHGSGAADNGLGEAQSLLEEARAATARLRGTG